MRNWLMVALSQVLAQQYDCDDNAYSPISMGIVFGALAFFSAAGTVHISNALWDRRPLSMHALVVTFFSGVGIVICGTLKDYQGDHPSIKCYS